jgi:histidinol-phosphate aminotransferase
VTVTVPDFAGLVRPGIRGLRAYDPGHDLVALRQGRPDLVELGSNENSWGCSERVADAIFSAMANLHRYPDPLGSGLKRALARKHDIDSAGVLLGNGSHELLMQFAQVFAGAGADVAISRYAFAVYRLAAQAAGARTVVAPARPVDDLMPRGHDLDAIAAAAAHDVRLVYLANPNNPTGTWFPAEALERLLSKLPPRVLVVVDEAYAEYVDDPTIGSAVDLLGEYPNLIVTRTFSKAHGLAGLRIGYALGHPSLVAVMERIRESFNVNLLGLAAAEASLADSYHLASVRVRNAAERRRLTDALRRRGLAVAPSQTNFLLVDFGPRCAHIEAQLLAAGVVLRPMAGYDLGQCLRVTVGRPEENDRLLQALDAVK